MKTFLAFDFQFIYLFAVESDNPRPPFQHTMTFRFRSASKESLSLFGLDAEKAHRVKHLLEEREETTM